LAIWAPLGWALWQRSTTSGVAPGERSAVLDTFWYSALGAEPPGTPRGEIVLDQQLIHQLRLFEKEIARSQYSEFCATVRMPPAAVIEHLEEASRAGDAHAQVLYMWVFRLIERYKEDGCGDT
jgi:hypothetical protein